MIVNAKHEYKAGAYENVAVFKKKMYRDLSQIGLLIRVWPGDITRLRGRGFKLLFLIAIQ